MSMPLIMRETDEVCPKCKNILWQGIGQSYSDWIKLKPLQLITECKQCGYIKSEEIIIEDPPRKEKE